MEIVLSPTHEIPKPMELTSKFTTGIIVRGAIRGGDIGAIVTRVDFFVFVSPCLTAVSLLHGVLSFV